MERSSSRSRIVNPMEWLRGIYETFGTPYPRLSLVAVMLLGAIFCGSAWLVLAKQVEKGHAEPAHSVNTTTWPQSPIMPNNGGSVTISKDAPEPAPPPKDKPK